MRNARGNDSACRSVQYSLTFDCYGDVRDLHQVYRPSTPPAARGRQQRQSTRDWGIMQQRFFTPPNMASAQEAEGYLLLTLPDTTVSQSFDGESMPIGKGELA